MKKGKRGLRERRVEREREREARGGEKMASEKPHTHIGR